MKSTCSTRNSGSVTRSPFQNLFLDTVFPDVFDQILGESIRHSKETMPTNVDLSETENSYEVSLDLPGVKAEDVEIQIEKKTLSIKGIRHRVSNENKKFHRIESSHGSFERKVVLQDAIDEENVTAEYADGVLLVTLPKVEEAKPRTIEIKQGS